MIAYVISRDLEGIMCALFRSFTDKVKPSAIYTGEKFQPSLNETAIYIENDIKKAERVRKALINYAGDKIMNEMFLCTCCNDEKAYLWAFNYAHLTLKLRANVSHLLNDNAVLSFTYAIQKVLKERHLISGFLRFKESKSGVLYATYSPDNDLNELVAPHFLSRLSGIPFIIHDLKRNTAVISDGYALLYTEIQGSSTFSPSNEELKIADLWHKYYKSINIKERKNAVQQKNFMPYKYRKFMSETWEK